MSIHSPHCPYHHPLYNTLQIQVKFNTRSTDKLNQAPFMQLCSSTAHPWQQIPGTRAATHNLSSWRVSIHFLTTKKCKAAEITLYPSLWGVPCSDYRSSCPLVNLYTFSICLGCLLFSIPPPCVLLSLASQHLATFTKPTPPHCGLLSNAACLHPQPASAAQNGNHSLKCFPFLCFILSHFLFLLSITPAILFPLAVLFLYNIAFLAHL